MNQRTHVGHPGDPREEGRDVDADEVEEFKPLTREEAEALIARHPPLSPWRVVMAQAVAGLVVAALAWLVTGKGEAAWSALYGAAVVVVPGALMARGMTGKLNANPGTAVLRFMLWEFVKILLAVAMLVAVARLVPNLSWLALLVAMLVCMKINGLALLRWGRVKQTQAVASSDR